MNNDDLHIKQSRSLVATIQRLCDVVTIGSTLYLSQWLAGQSPSDRSLLVSAVAVVLFFMVGELLGLYRHEEHRTAYTEIAILQASWVATLLLLAGIAFFIWHDGTLSRGSVMSWGLLTGAALGLVRMLFRIVQDTWVAGGWTRRRCAIAGLNPLGIQLLQNTKNNPECGLQVVGFFDDRAQDRWAKDISGQSFMLGNLEKLVAQAKAREIDTVFVTLPMRAEKRIRWLLNELADTTASVYIVPDFFVFELLHSRWNSIGGLPAVSIFETPLYGVDGWMKRCFDVAASSFGLVIITPILLICAALVKASSPGPVFFRQRRYGLDGCEFWVWKFRSMRTCDDGPNVVQATKDDDRITRVGRILRRTSLDELPQLLNVIEGSMSLVGPRPHANAHNEHYRKLIRGYMLRHKVKPGITGLAQVEGHRGETDTLDKMQKRIEFDHRYIQQWSLWLDIKILVRTIWVVFKQEQAH